ncbi:cytochrome P450 [Fomitiporia mediterranea MF3/22]|uniref:cytochrome P450 n=1 Tax=Fomitiporia mediterranea (strain MF3/22) TaxID=694068 RepID=UPI00044075D3|nr:cytochrome P450 [Fomitiporia mediterranea MF3/22]EJD05112.1 cytochrome P450 [Fomitiporia mediterranea MF3/22]
MGWELILPFLRYGPRFRKHRRIVHQHFGPTSIANFRSIQERETRKFLNRLLTNPDMFLNHIHNLIAGINLSVTYGHEVQSDNDAYIELVENAVHLSTSLGSLGTSVIDIFPFLRYLPASLPGMRLKRLTEKTRKVVELVMTVPLEDVKSKRIAGAAPQCVISDLLDKYDGMDVIDHEHEEDIMNIGASVYNAGTDTTKSTLTALFFMMTLHPEVSKSAQEEIDRVVGNHRLPSFDDRKDLPYVECLLKELYRYVNLCIPHGSTETEEYRGWTIPKGTIAIANIWQMMREETVFQNPDKFMPERFLDKAKASLGSLSPSKLPDGSHALSGEEDPSIMVFGFGRRVCPGKYLADSNLWLAIANVLAMFDIEPYTNPETREVELPKNEIEEDKVVLVLKPFKCKISPRNGRTSMVL